MPFLPSPLVACVSRNSIWDFVNRTLPSGFTIPKICKPDGQWVAAFDIQFSKPDECYPVYKFFWYCKPDEVLPCLIFFKSKSDEVPSDLHFILKCKLNDTSSGLHFFFKKINRMRCHPVYILFWNVNRMVPHPIYIFFLKKCKLDDVCPLPSGLQIFLKCKPDRVASGLQIINRIPLPNFSSRL